MGVWGHLSRAFYAKNLFLFSKHKRLGGSLPSCECDKGVEALHIFSGVCFPLLASLRYSLIWTEVNFCSLQLNRLSLLTLTSIFLYCLAARPSDLKGSSAHPVASFQFLSLSLISFLHFLPAVTFSSPFVSALARLAHRAASLFIFLSLIPDLPLVKIKETLDCWCLQLFLQIFFTFLE